MKIIWRRGKDPLAFNYPRRWFCLGTIGAAKSSFLETLAEHYLTNNVTVLDLFGSRDGEGLAWLRSPWVKDRKLLLVHGEGVDVKTEFDTKPTVNLTLKDLEAYDIIISSTPLYISPNQEFREVNRILDLLYKRRSWNKLVYAIAREASNLFYSRVKISKDQLAAKAEAIYLVRESRHMGLALGLDSLRFHSIDIDLRVLADYQIIKALGIHGLPRDLWFVYSFFKPEFLRNMPRAAFVIVNKRGALGVGSFPEVKWHKKEGENIVRKVGLKVEYGEEVDYGEDKRTFRTVGDHEHAEIVSLYVVEKKGMGKIAAAKDRSSSTIRSLLIRHDEAVKRSGFCPSCRRVHGEHQSDITRKGGVKDWISEVLNL